MTARALAIAFLPIALIAAAWATPAQTTSASKPPQPHQRPSRPTSAASRPLKNDGQLEADIRARLARSKIASDKFQVRVQGGVATIEGHTGVIQHKGVATRLAKSAGAAAVNNHVQIDDKAREAAAANLTKGRRRAQIKRGEARSDSGNAAPRQSR